MTRSLTTLVFLALAGLLCLAPAVSGIQVAMGDTVPLSGYSYGNPSAYLFITGPNLPINGAPLTDVTKHADQGYFTKVQVDGEGHWSYNWRTANLGLDEGVYTVWVVNGPNDLSNLAHADYRTISVMLTKPFVSAGSSSSSSNQYGSMEITSVPSGASVLLNGASRGRTPLTISNLQAGTYSLTFSYTGYADLSTQARVEAGRVSEIAATLEPVTMTPATPTTPASPVATGTIPATAKAAGILPAMSLAGIALAAWCALHPR